MMPWSTSLMPASPSLRALQAYSLHLPQRGDGRSPACGQEGGQGLEEVVFPGQRPACTGLFCFRSMKACKFGVMKAIVYQRTFALQIRQKGKSNLVFHSDLITALRSDEGHVLTFTAFEKEVQTSVWLCLENLISASPFFPVLFSLVQQNVC